MSSSKRRRLTNQKRGPTQHQKTIDAIKRSARDAAFPCPRCGRLIHPTMQAQHDALYHKEPPTSTANGSRLPQAHKTSNACKTFITAYYINEQPHLVDTTSGLIPPDRAIRRPPNIPRPPLTVPREETPIVYANFQPSLIDVPAGEGRLQPQYKFSPAAIEVMVLTIEEMITAALRGDRTELDRCYDDLQDDFWRICKRDKAQRIILQSKLQAHLYRTEMEKTA